MPRSNSSNSNSNNSSNAASALCRYAAVSRFVWQVSVRRNLRGKECPVGSAIDFDKDFNVSFIFSKFVPTFFPRGTTVCESGRYFFSVSFLRGQISPSSSA